MVFAAFIVAFLVFRPGSPVWPPPFQPRLPVGVTGPNTTALLTIASSSPPSPGFGMPERVIRT